MNIENHQTKTSKNIKSLDNVIILDPKEEIGINKTLIEISIQIIKGKTPFYP